MAWIVTATPRSPSSLKRRSKFPWAMTSSTRYLVDAGSTRPLRRFTRMRNSPRRTSFRLGQMISLNACFRLAPETLVFLELAMNALLEMSETGTGSRPEEDKR